MIKNKTLYIKNIFKINLKIGLKYCRFLSKLLFYKTSKSS